ncbi:MAG TPA: ATP-binding protein [Gammaproteobacteria bacterium]
MDTDTSDFKIAACLAVASEMEIVHARREGRNLAEQMDFSASDSLLVATAISELARNILHYAGNGEILLGRVEDEGKNRHGIAVIARDRGPGIPESPLAMHQSLARAANPGLGLPGIKQIMDEFEIDSRLGDGTTVTAVKWRQ